MQSSYIVMVPFLGILAIVQSVVGPRLTFLQVRPDLVLLAVMAWTLFNGIRSGIVWAFVGGLWMDLLSGGPMGGSSLALMGAALITGIGHNRFFHNNPIVPVSAAVLGTLVYSFLYLSILTLVNHRLSFWETLFQIVLPSTLYNSVLMFLLIPLLYRWLDRQELEMPE